MTLAIPASAQTETQGQEAQKPSQPKPTRTVKQPPPPLFPKHRRGLYKDREGLEIVDATPQSPPLETDDPGVPDKGEYEINLTTHVDLSEDVRRIDMLFVDANYGILPKFAGHELPTQLKFEFPVAALTGKNSPFTAGIGAAKFGMKFNFYNNEYRGLSLSVYPQIEFAAPGMGSVRKGLAEPGQTVILPLLVLKEFKYVTFVANGAVNKPLNDPERETTGTFGVGVGRALRRTYAAMIEVRSESTFDFQRDRLVIFNVGMLHGAGHHVAYVKVGRSLFADDGFSHTYLGVGLKVLIDPPARRP